MTMGNAREVPKRKNDEIYFERCMPLGVVMDERICSGSYYALAFRKFRGYLDNPTLLEKKPEVVIREVEKNKKGKYKLVKHVEADEVSSQCTEDEVVRL